MADNDMGPPAPPALVGPPAPKRDKVKDAESWVSANAVPLLVGAGGLVAVGLLVRGAAPSRSLAGIRRKPKKHGLSDRSAPISWARGSFGKAPKREPTPCEQVERLASAGHEALRGKAGYTGAKKKLAKAEKLLKACERQDNSFNAVSQAKFRVAELRKKLV